MEHLYRRVLTMKLEEIKRAVNEGKVVYWSNSNYQVIKDRIGQWLIYCQSNEHCIGLTWKDGATMNCNNENEFYMDYTPRN